MNVDDQWMPLAHVPHGFGIIILITLVISVLIAWLLHRKKML